MTVAESEAREAVDRFVGTFNRIRGEIGKFIVGHNDIVEHVLLVSDRCEYYVPTRIALCSTCEGRKHGGAQQQTQKENFYAHGYRLLKV